MTEYIDREAAIKAIEFSKGVGCSDRCVQGIKYIPAADVVEVVRCKDCAIPHNRWTGCPRMNGTIMRPDDYCSKGQRKEGEG